MCSENVTSNYSKISTSCIKRTETARDFRLPTQSEWDHRFSWMLRSLYCWLGTDVSGQPLNSVFALEDETRRFFRNVGMYQSVLPNIPEYRRPHFSCSLPTPMCYPGICMEGSRTQMKNPGNHSWSPGSFAWKRKVISGSHMEVWGHRFTHS